MQRDSRFVNGPRAGAAFADVSKLLLDDAKSCGRHHRADDVRCKSRFSAAAFTSVSAFVLLHCTQPGVYEARRNLLSELSAIAGADRVHGVVAAPRVPPVPVCK